MNAPSDATSSTPTPALARLTALLRQLLRITTRDGRVFLGTFAGTDKLLNVLLINTEEYRRGGYLEGFRTDLNAQGSMNAPEGMGTNTQGSTQDYTIDVDREGGTVGAMYEGRYVGQVLVPWKEVAKVELSVGGGPAHQPRPARGLEEGEGGGWDGQYL